MNVPESGHGRNRSTLALLGAVFLVPVMIAAALTFIGWQPGAHSHGEAIKPQRSFAGIDIRLADGSRYPWRADRPKMTLVALAGPSCGKHCLRTLDLLHNARVALNRHAGRLRLLYLGPKPSGPEAGAVMRHWITGTDVSGKLDGFRPMTHDKVAAILVESNGTALVLYRAGFDPHGVSLDLQKVVR